MSDIRVPGNLADARAALSMKRAGLPPRIVRWEHVDTREARPKYLINVADGNELTVLVDSGIPSLVVESGHVKIEFRSSWGNSLEISSGASAHVIVPWADTKVTIDNAGELRLQAPPTNRVGVFGPGTVHTD